MKLFSPNRIHKKTKSSYSSRNKARNKTYKKRRSRSLNSQRRSFNQIQNSSRTSRSYNEYKRKSSTKRSKSCSTSKRKEKDKKCINKSKKNKIESDSILTDWEDYKHVDQLPFGKQEPKLKCPRPRVPLRNSQMCALSLDKEISNIDDDEDEYIPPVFPPKAMSNEEEDDDFNYVPRCNQKPKAKPLLRNSQMCALSLDKEISNLDDDEDEDEYIPPVYNPKAMSNEEEDGDFNYDPKCRIKPNAISNEEEDDDFNYVPRYKQKPKAKPLLRNSQMCALSLDKEISNLDDDEDEDEYIPPVYHPKAMSNEEEDDDFNYDPKCRIKPNAISNEEEDDDFNYVSRYRQKFKAKVHPRNSKSESKCSDDNYLDTKSESSQSLERATPSYLSAEKIQKTKSSSSITPENTLESASYRNVTFDESQEFSSPSNYEPINEDELPEGPQYNYYTFDENETDLLRKRKFFGKAAKPPRAKFNADSTVSKPYNRAFQKLSFSNYVNRSPIKATEANLKPVVVGELELNDFQGTDNLLLGWTWIVNMTEQFFYDSSLLLLKFNNEKESDLQLSLSTSYNPRDLSHFRKYWKNITKIGQGGFGKVYKIYDKCENRFIAVKLIMEPKKDSLRYHRRLLLDFITERRYILNANKSNFVISFLYSGRLPKTSSLMLVFEYCVTDLSVAFKRIYTLILSDTVGASDALFNRTEDFLEDLYLRIEGLVGVRLYPILILYTFEMFCALDYLAKRNIIHRDIKPQNIMIAENLHLKLADFGLIYNTTFITRKTQLQLVQHDKIDISESSNFVDKVCGTEFYYDPEMCYHAIHKHPEVMKFWREHSYDIRNIKVHPFDPIHDFMSDLFAMAYSMIYIIFISENPFVYTSDEVRKQFGLTKHHFFDTVKLFMLKSSWLNFVSHGLTSIASDDTEELMELLVSCLDSRESRGKNIVDYKEFVITKDVKRRLPFVNINKVEKLAVFQRYDLTADNACLFNIDPEFGKLIIKNKRKVDYETFDDWIRSINTYKHPAIFKLSPGAACENEMI